jgi:hypothetical protein
MMMMMMMMMSGGFGMFCMNLELGSGFVKLLHVPLHKVRYIATLCLYGVLVGPVGKTAVYRVPWYA